MPFSFRALSLAAAVSVVPVATEAAVFLHMGSGADCRGQSCFAASRHYERSWSAGLLQAPTLVNSITLNRSLLGRLQDNMFTVNFYSADGALVGSLGSFIIAGLVGDELTLSGQGFTWDPSQGDLTVRLTLADWAPPGHSNAGGGGGGGFVPFFRSPASAPPPPQEETAPFFAAPPDAGPDGGPAAGVQPLVSPPPPPGEPQPQLAVSGAPEPAAWGLMIAGFGLAGAALRRRRLLAG